MKKSWILSLYQETEWFGNYFFLLLCWDFALYQRNSHSPRYFSCPSLGRWRQCTQDTEFFKNINNKRPYWQIHCRMTILCPFHSVFIISLPSAVVARTKKNGWHVTDWEKNPKSCWKKRQEDGLGGKTRKKEKERKEKGGNKERDSKVETASTEFPGEDTILYWKTPQHPHGRRWSWQQESKTTRLC